MVAMIIIHHVPIVDDQPPDALAPDVDGATGQRFLRPGFQSGAIHAVGNTIIFPGEIVTSFLDKPGIDLEIFPLRELALADSEMEFLGLERPDVGLVDQFFEFAVVIGIDRLHEEFLAVAFVTHMHTPKILHREQSPQIRSLKHDRFIGPIEIDRIANRHQGARRSRGRGNGRQEKAEGHDESSNEPDHVLLLEVLLAGRPRGVHHRRRAR